MAFPSAFAPVEGVRCSPKAADGVTEEGIVWQIVWTVAKKRREQTMGRCRDVLEARERANALLESGVLGIKRVKARKQAAVPRMWDVFTAGWRDLETDRGVRASSKRSYSFALRNLRLHLDDLPVDKLSREALYGYVDARTSAGAAPATLKVEMAVLSRCWRAYHGTTVPPALPHVPLAAEPTRDIYCPTAEEIRAVLEWVRTKDPRPWCYVALVLLWGTGARSEEVAHLRWEDVFLKQGRLRLGGANGGKTGGRNILTDPASPWWKVLVRWYKTHGDLTGPLLGVTPRTMQGKLTNEVLRAACDALSIQRFTLHAIRHAAVTAFCSSNSVNAAEVKARFGHSIKTAMERYVQPSEANLAEKAAKAGLGAL